MNTTIKCPSCGTSFAITDALKSQLEGEISLEVKSKFEKEKDETIKKTVELLKAQYEEKLGLELDDLKKNVAEKQARVDELRESELKLREEKRKLEEARKDIELEFSRKLEDERKRVEETILRKTDEQHRLKDLEKEKVIGDLRKALEEAQRKASQGSQQLQGEVLELDLEKNLRQNFPHDEIVGVAKGVHGADIKQTVKTVKGTVCGVILWEVKRQKAWNNEWTKKLKEDLREIKADIPVLVSTVLPKDFQNKIGQIDGIWVSDPYLSLVIADMFRQKLIDLARERFIAKNKETKAETIYEYITSQDFRQQIEHLAETYMEMKQQIDKEKIVFEKLWKTREAQCTRLLKSTASIVGEMQGCIGQNSLPAFKGLDILSLSAENQNE